MNVLPVLLLLLSSSLSPPPPCLPALELSGDVDLIFSAASEHEADAPTSGAAAAEEPAWLRGAAALVEGAKLSKHASRASSARRVTRANKTAAPGKPRASAAGTSPYGCARGNLHVYIRLRALKESARRYASAAAAAAIGGGVLVPWLLRRLAPRRTWRLVPVLSVWTGPGPGISKPFRRWGKPGLWKYRMEREYVD